MPDMRSLSAAIVPMIGMFPPAELVEGTGDDDHDHHGDHHDGHVESKPSSSVASGALAPGEP